MTQGTIIPPAVDQDSIEYGHVYANYVKSVADTPGDPDANPDIIHVNGQVTFDSTFPGASARGSIRLPAEPRAYGLIVTGDTFEITNSKLVDHEGREGVRLIASVDGVPLSWQAVVTLTDSSGRTIYNQSYIIHHDLWDSSGELLHINLPDLIPTPSRLEPPEGAAVRAAEKALEEIEALTATNQQIKLDIEGLKSEVVALHGQTGQRLTAAEAARDAAVVAQGLAEAAQSASEAAQSQAQTARAGAQTARTDAESARDEAQGHAQDAAGSASAADQSATDADGHRAAAATSETNAGQSASDADAHRAAAEVHASDAATALSGAEDARDAAQHAQSKAEDERVVAVDAADQAQGHAQAADGHRVDAEAAAALAQSLRWVVRGAWEPGQYEAGDVVVWDERAYYAQTATSAQPPAQPWVPLTPAGGGASHWDELDGKPTLFPPEAHTHDAADVSGAATPLLDVTEASVGAQSVGEALDATTDASRLEGALTDQVDTSGATIEVDFGNPGGPETTSLSGAYAQILYLVDAAQYTASLKADADHTHPVSDVEATGTASSSTYLRGDGTWATPPNSVYSVPSQAEAEEGTATTGRAFSAQRVRQAANAAISAREWTGTQAQYDAISNKDPNVTYYVVEG